MYDSLVGIINAIVTSAPGFKKSQKRVLGNTLSKLLFLNETLVSDGKKLIALFAKAQRMEKIDFREFYLLLQNQAYRLQEIMVLLKQNKINKVLGIYLPQCENLKLHIDQKGQSISFLYDELWRSKQNILTIEINHPIFIKSYSKGSKLKLPSKNALRESRKQIKELQGYNVEIREFIKSTFSVEDLV